MFNGEVITDGVQPEKTGDTPERIVLIDREGMAHVGEAGEPIDRRQRIVVVQVELPEVVESSHGVEGGQWTVLLSSSLVHAESDTTRARVTQRMGPPRRTEPTRQDGVEGT